MISPSTSLLPPQECGTWGSHNVVQVGMDIRTTLTTPGWHRSLLIRRTLASLLLLAAATLLAQSLFSEDPRVVVIVRDVPAGAEITADDTELQPVPADFLPHTAFHDSHEVVGRIAASTISAGEIATAPRFIGNELIASFVANTSDNPSGESLTMVPLKLADPSVIPLLRHGDTISVVSYDLETGLPRTVAARGRVVLAGDSDPSTVLIALPESTAGAVAAASLSSPLAVLLTGDRAG